MKSNNIIYIFSLLILLSGFTACKKQVAIDPPVTELVTSNVFSNNGTATSAQLSIYGQMYLFPYNLHQFTGLSSDELYSFTNNQSGLDLYLNAIVKSEAQQNPLSTFWPYQYNYVYQLNAILENLQQSTGVNAKVKQQLTGEAEFMRAYFYFYLVNLYGDVPMATTTNYKVNAALSRTPKGQVYEQIVKDLTAAQVNLSTKYVDATDTTATIERIRPTTWAADALLARVYLYMGSGYYKQAEDQAAAVINATTMFTLPSDLNMVFKKNSSETIWQIANYNGSTLDFTPDGRSFVLTSPPAVTLSNSSIISAQLMNAFESGDQRLVKWVGTFTSGSSSWNYPAKYKDNGVTAATTSEYTTILRLAEQYLIRAEARAQQGNLTGALADLNTIRNRAGLGNYAGATDQASLISAVSHERQVELFAEGDRWINLKRTGTINAVMSIVTPQKGGTWNSYQQLYPLPPSDVLNDNNLTQNAGY
jgi:hypothetical protein